jgi:hypothetical protein
VQPETERVREAIAKLQADAADACPTGCGRSAAFGHRMCRACWALVPKHLQRAVNSAWRAHRNAMRTGGVQCAVSTRKSYEHAKAAALASIP